MTPKPVIEPIKEPLYALRARVCGSASLRPSDRWSLVVAPACGPVGPREQGRGDGSLTSHVPGSSWSLVAWSSWSVQRLLRCPCPSSSTETERDFFSFLALEPSRGLGCGYVGLIVSRWLTLTREGWASASRRAAGRARHGKAIRSPVSGRTVVGACAALGGALKDAQIGSCDFGTEVSGDSGGLRSYRHRL